MNDLRQAFRLLTRAPGFTAVAVLSLALAIGVNCGVFTIINSLFLRPLIPLRPAEVVSVYTARAGANRAYRAFAFEELSLLREEKEVFADVAAFRPATVGIGTGDHPELRRKFGFVVSEDYFPMLGVTPALGRFFLPAETRPDAEIPVVVVSHALWESLGGGADLRDRTLSINQEPWTIVGVAPKGFSGGNALLGPEVWLPLGMASRVSEAFGAGNSGRRLFDPANYALFVVARLRAGLSRSEAESRLPAIGTHLNAIAANAADGARTVSIAPLSRFSFSTEPSSDGPLLIFGMLLLGMSGAVLLVACLNLANMFLARGTSRAPELAVRLALGASRWRVVRLLFAEGLLVALLAGFAGLLLSEWGNALLLGSLMRSSVFSSLGFSLALDPEPDMRVWFATLVFGLGAALLFSIGPALRITGRCARGIPSLHTGDRTTTDRGSRMFSGRHCLLMAQLALSFALIFSAGLFLRAAYSAARFDPGFESAGDLVAELDYAMGDHDEAAVPHQLARVIDGMRKNPAVRTAALASHLPLGGETSSLGAVPGDAASPESAPRVRGITTAVSSDYFAAIGVPLRRGRDFSENEWRDPAAPPVVIIDERMAAALFPNEDPVGRTLRVISGSNRPPGEPLEIVGVVSAHHHVMFSAEPPPRLFFPLGRRFTPHVFVHLPGRTPGGTVTVPARERIREELRALDARIPLVQLTPFATILNGNLELWTVRFLAVLFAVFGTIALLLAVVGVYGVQSFMVTRRTREIGIRIAIGAQPSQVHVLLLKQGATRIAIGLTAGTLLALGAGQLLASMLLRVAPYDPFVLLAAALPLAAAASLATWLPARRAMRISPVEALRAE